MRQDRHRTLPVMQRIPDAEHSAQDIAGVRSTHVRSQSLDTKTDNKPPLRTPIFRRRQNVRGISGQLQFDPHSKRALTIPTPIRSSLAQKIALYKVQVSHYISMVKPFGMAPGYPVAHVLSLVNTSPTNRTNRPRPRSGPDVKGPYAGSVGNRGGVYYMQAPRRFSKALPVAINNYEPPTY